MVTTIARKTELPVSPLANAERLRFAMREESVAEYQSQLGQFLSPLPIAEFMATLFPTITGDVRLLDPGAGVGSLTAAFVEEACSRKRRPKSINVSAYEIDCRQSVSRSSHGAGQGGWNKSPICKVAIPRGRVGRSTNARYPCHPFRCPCRTP